MNEQRLQEIKERAKKAMSAPWHTNSKNEILIEDDGRLGKMIRRYEAEFIVHAREDVPALITEVERLREALKQILEDEAPNCDGYETFIHATARKALAGDNQ